jgi:hypothetical protein
LFAEVSNRSHAGKAVANLNTLNYNYNLSKFSATYRAIWPDNGDGTVSVRQLMMILSQAKYAFLMHISG